MFDPLLVFCMLGRTMAACMEMLHFHSSTCSLPKPGMQKHMKRLLAVQTGKFKRHRAASCTVELLQLEINAPSQQQLLVDGQCQVSITLSK
jgi:hypothetical protein